MNTTKATATEPVLKNLDRLIPDLEALYKDIHAHPELSMQETRTAGLAADRLRAAGYEVTTGVGRTGVVGLLRNGDGPTVMLRADMDALPVREASGVDYASTVTATPYVAYTSANSIPTAPAPTMIRDPGLASFLTAPFEEITRVSSIVTPGTGAQGSGTTSSGVTVPNINCRSCTLQVAEFMEQRLVR